MQHKLKTYLVGGAIRDRLLGLEVKDRDYVVVGATPEQMRALDFRQVGADFPVFLHPTSHEEYALARTERKTGAGYLGFSVDFSPDVSLEEDLRRRDLTINALAEDELGEIIDPYGGLADLQSKKLRHVSIAFREDPVRILRTARFAARFKSLGFDIAPETLALMSEMVDSGEASHLVAERVWQEWQTALSADNPQVFIQVLRQCGAYQIIAPELDSLYGAISGDRAGSRGELALAAAATLTPRSDIRFAALIAASAVSAAPPLPQNKIQQWCQGLAVPKSWQQLVLLATEHLVTCHRAVSLDAPALLVLLEQTDAFRRPGRFDDLLITCEADFRANSVVAGTEYLPAQYLRNALTIAAAIEVKPLVDQGLLGPQISAALHDHQLTALQGMMDTAAVAEHFQEKT